MTLFLVFLFSAAFIFHTSKYYALSKGLQRLKKCAALAPVIILVFLICPACSFIAPQYKSEETPYPEFETVFSSENTDRALVGMDAAGFYYSSFMDKDISEYWRISGYELISSEVLQDSGAEFTVSVKAYIEALGDGFSKEENPLNPGTLFENELLPEFLHVFKIKELGSGNFEILDVSPKAENSALKDEIIYSIKSISFGKAYSDFAYLSGNDAQLASSIITDYMLKSSAFPGIDVSTLKECYVIRSSFSDNTHTDYYAFEDNGYFNLQPESGYYSHISPYLFSELKALAEIKSGSFSKVLDHAVSKAILAENSKYFNKGEFETESHITLKTDINENFAAVYTIAMYAGFSYPGGNLSETVITHSPAAITFRKNDDGTYSVSEYWTPEEGSQYSPSIRSKFPGDIYGDAMSLEKYALPQTQSCYKKAVEYKNTDTAKTINFLVLSIMSSPKNSSGAIDYINEHAGEYRELLYYGEYTLKYIFDEFARGNETGLKGNIMLTLLDELLGDESPGFENTDAQEAFNEWAAFVSSIYNENGEKYMKEKLPKSFLYILTSNPSH